MNTMDDLTAVEFEKYFALQEMFREYDPDYQIVLIGVIDSVMDYDGIANGEDAKTAAYMSMMNEGCLTVRAINDLSLELNVPYKTAKAYAHLRMSDAYNKYATRWEPECATDSHIRMIAEVNSGKNKWTGPDKSRETREMADEAYAINKRIHVLIHRFVADALEMLETGHEDDARECLLAIADVADYMTEFPVL